MWRNLGYHFGVPWQFFRQTSFPIVQEEMGVSKNRGKTSKMDGLFHGNPYEQMDDLGVKPPYFWKHTNVCLRVCFIFVYPFTVDVCLDSRDVYDTPGNFHGWNPKIRVWTHDCPSQRCDFQVNHVNLKGCRYPKWCHIWKEIPFPKHHFWYQHLKF